MYNEDEFSRSLDELLKQILAESEASEEPAEDEDSDEILDLITSEVDPDLHVCIQHEVTKAIRKMIPILHRHVMTTITTSLETYSETVIDEVRQTSAMYSQSVREGTDQLRAEIVRLQRMGRWLKWIVVMSWMLLAGMLVGSMRVYGVW